jgi:hypothetical protein
MVIAHFSQHNRFVQQKIDCLDLDVATRLNNSSVSRVAKAVELLFNHSERG